MFIELTLLDGTKFLLMTGLIVTVVREDDGRATVVFQTRDMIQKEKVQENYSTIVGDLRCGDLVV